MRAISRPKSIKSRLLFSTGFVFLIAWFAAAVFTKLIAFDQSRDFLAELMADDATNMLSLVNGQSLNKVTDEGHPNRAILVWRGEELILSRGRDIIDDLLTFKQSSIDTVKKINGENWVISSRCNGADCVVAAIRDTERKFAIRRLVTSIFAPLFALLILILIGLYVAVQYGLRPLDTLAKDVTALDLGKLDRLPARNHPQELKLLKSAIDTLTLNMADQLDRERTFLDACAHEIRTPVTGLISQVQAIETSEISNLPPKMKEQFSLIERSAQRTARVANQFLNLAKSNNTLADLSNAVSFDLCEMIRTVLADIIVLSPKANIQMAGESSLMVCGDPFTVELIVQNLIENALKHGVSDEECRIIVTCSRMGDEVTISVADNGSGVPVAALTSLAERFFRAEKNDGNLTDYQNISTSKGAGLGLSIVKEIAETWGGKLAFKKSAELGGLEATVSLKVLNIPHKMISKEVAL